MDENLGSLGDMFMKSFEVLLENYQIGSAEIEEGF